jgi:hypothetical protein
LCIANYDSFCEFQLDNVYADVKHYLEHAGNAGAIRYVLTRPAKGINLKVGKDS